jgi:hypothetical protein
MLGFGRCDRFDSKSVHESHTLLLIHDRMLARDSLATNDGYHEDSFDGVLLVLIFLHRYNGKSHALTKNHKLEPAHKVAKDNQRSGRWLNQSPQHRYSEQYVQSRVVLMIDAGERRTHKRWTLQYWCAHDDPRSALDSSDFAAAPLETLPPSPHFTFGHPCKAPAIGRFRKSLGNAEMNSTHSINKAFVSCWSHYVKFEIKSHVQDFWIIIDIHFGCWTLFSPSLQEGIPRTLTCRSSRAKQNINISRVIILFAVFVSDGRRQGRQMDGRRNPAKEKQKQTETKCHHIKKSEPLVGKLY